MNSEFSAKEIKFVKALHELSNSSKKGLYSIVFVLFSVHLSLSLYLKDFTWLAAFGALLSIFGLLVSFSYALPLEDIDPKDLEPTQEGDHYTWGGSPLAELITDKASIERIKQSNINDALKRHKNISTYIVFTVLGTLIWAYAGFFNMVFVSLCA